MKSVTTPTPPQFVDLSESRELAFAAPASRQPKRWLPELRSTFFSLLTYGTERFEPDERAALTRALGLAELDPAAVPLFEEWLAFDCPDFFGQTIADIATPHSSLLPSRLAALPGALSASHFDVFTVEDDNGSAALRALFHERRVRICAAITDSNFVPGSTILSRVVELDCGPVATIAVDLGPRTAEIVSALNLEFVRFHGSWQQFMSTEGARALFDLLRANTPIETTELQATAFFEDATDQAYEWNSLDPERIRVLHDVFGELQAVASRLHSVWHKADEIDEGVDVDGSVWRVEGFGPTCNLRVFESTIARRRHASSHGRFLSVSRLPEAGIHPVDYQMLCAMGVVPRLTGMVVAQRFGAHLVPIDVDDDDLDRAIAACRAAIYQLRLRLRIAA